jgi:hypothetical protein
MCIYYSYKDIVNVKEINTSSLKLNKRKVRLIRTSRLRGWYTGTYIEIANTKRGYINKNGFEDYYGICTKVRGTEITGSRALKRPLPD